ncbi:MAG: hypothetical protein IPM17_15210 [Verrucomicrobia bacterium]|nr:hypothetical protein [Verrucomicrobiota bacterium]
MTPRHQIFPPIGLLRPVGLLAGLLALAPLLPAADITWRGGFSDDFSDARNWNLPPDIPPGTPADQRESFRRVPRAGDHAILATGEEVRLSGGARIERLTFNGGRLNLAAGGQLVVTGTTNGPSVLSGTVAATGGGGAWGGAVELGQAELRIEGGGVLAFDSPLPATLAKRVLVQGGELRFAGRVRFDERVTLRGGRLNVPAEGEGRVPSEFRAPLELEAGAPDAANELVGVFETRADVDWFDADVVAGPITFRQEANLDVLPPDPPRREPREWQGETLTFQSDGGLRRFDTNRLFLNAPVVFTRGFGISNAVVAGPNQLRPLELFRRVDVDHPVDLPGPITYGFGSELHLNVPGATLSGTTVDDHRVHRIELGVLFVKADAEADVIEMDGGGIAFTPAVAGGRATLRIRPAGSFQLLDGAITRGTGTGVLELAGPEIAGPGAAVLRLGGEGSLRVGGGRVAMDCDVLNRGTIVFREDGRFNQTIQAGGAWINLGDIFHVEGHGVSESSRLHLVNHGLVAVEPREVPVDSPAFNRFTRLAFTLLNENESLAGLPRGTVQVLPTNLTVEVAQGENRGVIELADGVCLQIATGVDELISYQVDNHPPVTRTFNRRFVLRQEGQLILGRDSCLKVLSFGSFGFPQFLAGLETEAPLFVDHLQLGGRAGAQPGIFFGAPLQGVGLSVRKSFAWFGGNFRGEAGADQRVELGADCATVIRSTEDHPGANVGVQQCTVRHHGTMIVNTRHAVTAPPGATGILNEPGGHILVQRAAFVQGLVNRGRVVQNQDLEDPDRQRVSYGDLRQQGEFVVEQGDAQIGFGSRVERPVSVPNASSAVEFFGTTLVNTRAADGPAVVTVEETRVEGKVEVENVQLGKTTDFGSVIPAITSGNNATVTILRSALWKSGHIQLGEDSRVVIGPEAKVVIAPENANRFFSIFDRGTVENHGRVEYHADSTSKVLWRNQARWENRPGSVFTTEGTGEVFRAEITPGQFVNQGGQVRFNVPRNGTQSFNAEFQQTDGETTMSGVGGAALARPQPSPPRRAAPDPRERMEFRFRVFGDGGRLICVNLEVDAFLEFTQTGGLFQFDKNSTGRFRRAVEVRGGRLVFLRGNAGTFNSGLHISGGIVDVDADADLTLEEPFRLDITRNILSSPPRTGVLSGRGTIFGNVHNAGVISPGLNEGLVQFGTLTVNGDVTFTPSGVLELDVPVNEPNPEGDRLLVNGRATLAGTVTATPSFNPPLIVNDAFVEVLRANVIQGGFADLATVPFGNRKFALEPRDNPPRVGLKVEFVPSGDDDADLELLAGPTVVAETNAAVTLRLDVVNRGPAGANQIGLDVALPAGVTFIESATPLVLKENGRVIGFNLATLNRGDTNVVRFTVRAPAAPGAMQFNATAASQKPDPVPANNALALVVPVLGAEGFRVGAFDFAGPGGTPRLAVATLPGVRYRLERSTDLATWTPVREFTGDGTTQVLTGLPVDGAEGFFRLVIL